MSSRARRQATRGRLKPPETDDERRSCLTCRSDYWVYEPSNRCCGNSKSPRYTPFNNSWGVQRLRSSNEPCDEWESRKSTTTSHGQR